MVHREIQVQSLTRGPERRHIASVGPGFYGNSNVLAMVFARPKRHLKLMPDAKYTVRTKRTKTTTEITVERVTLVALRGLRTQRGWCHQCAANMSLVTAEDAAAASRVSVGTIYQWVELGRLHFSNAAVARPLVCLGVAAEF
jgi:hypothetical protein